MKNNEETITQIREFNRFYTVFLGFLNRNYLDSGYSVTETRILFELRQNRQMSAAHITSLLNLDKSYISRIIRSFEQKGLITRTSSQNDRRALIIQLTSKGLEEAEKLIEITNSDLAKRIQQLDADSCNELCHSMKKIIEIFSENNDLKEEHHER